MAATETIDRAIVIARMLRTVDKVIADAKSMERDREELRRMLQSTSTAGAAS